VLTVEFGLRQLRVRITDNGKGLSTRPPEPGALPHFGLSGMRERAERLKASFTIETEPRRGTEISLSLSSNVAYVPKSSAITGLPGRMGNLLGRMTTRFLRRAPGTGNPG
jgi:signal transduction histidine kinase